jgi:hypothetical protein
LLSLGRLLRVPRFVGNAGEELTKRVKKQFKESSKVWETEEEQSALREFLLSLQGKPISSASESGDDVSMIDDLVPQQQLELQSYRAFWNTREGMFTLREALSDIVIRRDERSTDNEGRPLLGLRPKLEIISYIKLDEQTETALNSQTATKEDRSVNLTD